MRTKTVTLADREFEIRELPSRRNREWRAMLAERLAPLVDLIERAPGLELSADNVAGLTEIAQVVREVLVQSPEIMIDLVFEYSPELTKHRDEIEAEAFDSEFLTAFQAVLGLAYGFFGQAIQALNKIGPNG